jgi:hypothetical protein
MFIDKKKIDKKQKNPINITFTNNNHPPSHGKSKMIGQIFHPVIFIKKKSEFF